MRVQGKRGGTICFKGKPPFWWSNFRVGGSVLYILDCVFLIAILQGVISSKDFATLARVMTPKTICANVFLEERAVMSQRPRRRVTPFGTFVMLSRSRLFPGQSLLTWGIPLASSD
jgi:hypothetical protein